MQRVEKWDIFEIEFKGRSDKNPFVDYWIRGTFTGADEKVTVDGFYDGDGVYKIRFMPAYEGVYTYRIEGSFSDEVTEGKFEVTPAVSANNHGRVRVIDETHLGYEDGRPYYSIGTTCYAWVYQTESLQEQTLETLKNSPFNKIRFCMFPKYYEFNLREPAYYPYERGSGEGLDMNLVEKEAKERIVFPGMKPPVMDFNFNYYKPCTATYQRFDRHIRKLRDMGIEADIILMHPYDRWGLNDMNKEACDLYIRYMTARYGAYRNVWWSLANEYDIISTKSEDDWERYAAIICEKDVYGHLRSIHNCMRFYDYSKPWVTHCSLQRLDFYAHCELTEKLISQYHKPAVWDENCYEGNIHVGWGNITAEEMVRRFWESFMRGGHAGHGETYVDDHDILWWSHGGILKGDSAPRLQFLLDILKETPGKYLKEGTGLFDEAVGVAGAQINDADPWSGYPSYEYEIHYLGFCRPAYRMFYLPEDQAYEIDVIDTWHMTVTPAGIHSGETRIELPGHQYMAIRLKKVNL